MNLIRLPNLLIIVLTQYLTDFFIIKPVLESCGVRTNFDETAIFLLILMTVLITSAAYILNDFFDREIDKINKPGFNLFDRYNKTILLLIYAVFNLMAVIIGFYLAYQTEALLVGWIVFSVIILLYLYSARYKKQLIIGNIIVAFLSAFVIIIVWLFEFYSYRSFDGNTFENIDNISTINNIILFYAFFAFLLSLAREIVKDVEDIEGDACFHCRTLPLVVGVKISKFIAGLIISVVVVLMFLLEYKFYAGYKILSLFFLFAVQIPLIYLIYRLIGANIKQEYHYISAFLKVIMLIGILSMTLWRL